MATQEMAAATPRAETVPRALWAIALAALIPFPASAIVYVWGPAELARPALTVILTWSGVVLAFLGGVRWGLESGRPSPRSERMLISVASAVAAWALLLLRHSVPDSWIVAGCIVAFLLQWLFDHQAPDVPSRYPMLSTALTAGACISLALVLDGALKV